MKNFSYNPELEYILDDINTIENTNDFNFNYEDVQVFNSPLITLNQLEENIDKINELISIIDERLKDFAIKITVGDFEDPILTILKELSDGERFIDEGILSYQLYKESLDIPLLFAVPGIWDEYHAGINGMVEAEVLPYLHELKYDNESLKKVMLSTIYYGKNTSNREELELWEVKELERFLELKHNINIKFMEEEVSPELFIKTQLERDNRESRQEINSQLNEMISIFAKNCSKTTHFLGEDLKEETKTQKSMAIREQSINTKSINKDMEKFLIYNSFKSDKEKLYAMKQEFLKTSRKDKSFAYNGYITNNRIANDIAMPLLHELKNNDLKEESEFVYSQIISGAEVALKELDDSSINLKNTISSSIKNSSLHIDYIMEKDKCRILYKNVK